MKIKLNDELAYARRKNNVKAKDLVKYILDTVLNATTDKTDIMNTALKDIKIDGKPIIKAYFDRIYLNVMYIELGRL